MTNIAMVVLVFCIGFGWGVATMTLFCLRHIYNILDFAQNVLDLNQQLIRKHDELRENVGNYTDLTYKSFSACIGENQKIVEGLKKLVDAVKEEDEREGFQRDNE